MHTTKIKQNFLFLDTATQNLPKYEVCEKTEKFMYSYRQAKEMVTKLKFARRNSGTGKMHIYKCEHCKCWHLSSKGRFDHYHDDLMEIRNRQLKEIYAA